MANPSPNFGPRDPAASSPWIIVIGLNRCATLSLHTLFERSGIASVHWQRASDGRNIARTMLTNIALGRPPLEGFGTARAFSDLAYLDGRVVIEGARFFRELHAAYPDAYFILNTRPVDGWVASRLSHAGGGYLRRAMKATGLDRDALIARWRALHATHDSEVSGYFAGNPRFLRFDITTDDPAAIARLLAPDFTLDLAHWGLSNRRPAASAPSPTATPHSPGG